MDDTTSDTLDQAHEEILTYTVSDEALEAAASIGRLEGLTISYCNEVGCSLHCTYKGIGAC
jgi:hypothetical protein